MTFTIEEAETILHERWGYRAFRKSQRAAMECVGEGDDVLAVLPTGTGKSLLYQLPALLCEGGTIVISPLIALMKDQVDQAVARGIPAACINSAMDEDDQWEAVEGFVNGSTKILYISPERIGVRSFLSTIIRADVAIIAVDEAHCCHPAGTRVSTLSGLCAIENLRIGDSVLACDAHGHSVSRRITDHRATHLRGRGLLRLHLSSGEKLEVTGDHKVWTEELGYVEACEIQVGDILLRRMLQASNSASPERAGTLLQQSLLRPISTERNLGTTRTRLPALQQSVRTKAERSNRSLLFQELCERIAPTEVCRSTVPRMRNFVQYPSATNLFKCLRSRVAWSEGFQSIERRRTHRAVTAREFSECSVAVLRSGSSSKSIGKRKDRPCVSVDQIGNRIGRTRTPIRKESPTRPEARRSVEATRVVGVEILIRPGDIRSLKLGERDQIVYSITVEEHHNYFAEEVLVANCSQWGHQFRPDYLHIHRLIRALSDGVDRPQVLGLTATATPIVVEDIVASLGINREEVTILVDDPIRHNLTYQIEDGGMDGGGASEWNVFRRMVHNINVNDGRHLVYCSSRRGAEKLAEMCEDIHGNGIAVAYHAGLASSKRLAVQEDFSDENGDARIVCATTAFGMGIDIPDIRTVTLFGFPGSLEDYTQQIGRAGRDGLRSKTCMIGSQGSAEWQMKLIENENPPVQHYRLVWDHLHDILQPGAVMRTNRNALSQEITSKRVTAMTPDQVGVVLNRLHSTGLIERRPIKEGVPVTVDRHALVRAIHEAEAAMEAGTGKTKPQILHIWRTFLQDCVQPEFERENCNRLEVWINKTALGEQAGMTQWFVQKGLEQLQGKRGAVLNIGKSVAGVLVKIIKWRAELSEELPVARIEEKRTRDLARFQRLLKFARTRSEEDRKQMLRDYFLRSVDANA